MSSSSVSPGQHRNQLWGGCGSRAAGWAGHCAGQQEVEEGSTSNWGREHPLVQAHMQAYVIQPQIRTLIEPLTRTNICTFCEAEVWPVAQIYKLRVIIICRPCTRRSPRVNQGLLR